MAWLWSRVPPPSLGPRVYVFILSLTGDRAQGVLTGGNRLEECPPNASGQSVPSRVGGDPQRDHRRQRGPPLPGGLSQRLSSASKRSSAAWLPGPSRRRACPWCDPGAWRRGPGQAGAGALPVGAPGHWTMGVEPVTRDIPGQRGQLEAGRDRVHGVAGPQSWARSRGKPACPCHPCRPLGQALGWLPFPCGRPGARRSGGSFLTARRLPGGKGTQQSASLP